MWAGYEDEIRKSDPAILCVQGSVCGAIIYIACSNLLAREFQRTDDINPYDMRENNSKVHHQGCINFVKFIFVLMGISTILLIYTIGGSDLTTPDQQIKNKVKFDLGLNK